MVQKPKEKRKGALSAVLAGFPQLLRKGQKGRVRAGRDKS